MIEAEKMRRILNKVQQGILTPGQALNDFQDGFARDGPMFEKLRKNENYIMGELEALREGLITQLECEEGIKCILNGIFKKKEFQLACLT